MVRDSADEAMALVLAARHRAPGNILPDARAGADVATAPVVADLVPAADSTARALVVSREAVAWEALAGSERAADGSEFSIRSHASDRPGSTGRRSEPSTYFRNLRFLHPAGPA